MAEQAKSMASDLFRLNAFYTGGPFCEEVSGSVRAYSWTQLRRLCACEAAVTQRRQELSTLQKAAEQRAEQQRSAVALVRRRQLTEALHGRVERRARAMEEAAGVAEYLGRRVAEASEAGAAASDTADQRRRRISRTAPGLRQERIIVEDLRAMLARQRGRVAADIQQAFPVELRGDAWTVCGLRVGRGGGNQVSEESAAALGIVAWIVEYVARGLGVALRFPPIARAARSAVVAPAGAVEWPLFVARASDRPRQRMAQKLLAVDVEQLLWLFGIGDVDRRALLPNLIQLLMAIEACSFAP
ncbi:hypothetical protein H4R20_002909 [Coemansia guatemalensis]|uniref:Uncharacterized protein n=1 Tax=Coemansia guatemalensis TaxID=2761395 RepID=A0A9W8HZ41_9FUNG|nr:hypothetical protein H4R20_002909 [Coemansia guatemalensis]